MSGKHLTHEQRLQIETLYKYHAPVRDIAEQVGCSTRTVYRELQLGKCRLLDGLTYEFYDSYSSYISDTIHAERSNIRGKRLKLSKSPALVAFLEDYIGSRHYSPEAALQEIQLQGLDFGITLSVTTVYRYIYAGQLKLCSIDLPVGRYTPRKEEHDQYISKKHKDDKCITDRPADAADRLTSGYWEMDTVIGKAKGVNQCLLVLTERKTRFEIVRVLSSKSAAEVVRCLDELRNSNPSIYDKVFRGITCDNGCEFSNAAAMEQLSPVYFCHPYSSWERGSNENQNKLIRRFSPKGKSMNQLTSTHVEYIQLWMNHYPRKILGWQRPADLFYDELKKLGIYDFVC